MRDGLLILFVSVFLAGCKGRNNIPKHILSKAEMQAVMWDMIRADQFLTNFVLNKDSSLNKDTASIKLYQEVFDLHHISKEKFQQSFDFYKSHPDLFKILLDSLNAKPTIPITPVPVNAPTHIIDTIQLRKKIKKALHNKE